MREIFCFGSNLSGIHGAGAARYALDNHGAIWGQGEGLQGDSYALPTKGFNITFISLKDVKYYVDQFIRCAEMHPELKFKVTRVGCFLAGFTDVDIAPLFENAPRNCFFDTKWEPYLGDRFYYWGTFG
jgi:hypothetical protein